MAAGFEDFSQVEVVAWGERGRASADLIINATSLSLNDELPVLAPGSVHERVGCYDMVYNRTGTSFTRWAESQGAAFAVDGLGMLVEQAAEAFRVWTDRQADIEPVRELLRAA